MIEMVHDDGRCIERTPDAVIIAEREAAGYNPVAIANQIHSESDPQVNHVRKLGIKSRRIASRG